MEIDPSLTQIDFQVAISSFREQLLGKLDYLNNIQIQLLRKFECSINLPESHSELVFYLRNLVLLIEQSFKDVAGYFNDLHMNILYDFFRKIQLLMLNGFNFLSQALVLQMDLNNKQKEPKNIPKQLEMQKLILVNRTSVAPTLKEQAKQLQHYDYAINFYENEERKVADELHRMQDNILLSKGLIDKLHPSKAVKQLEQIKERAEITLQNTQNIFEETYQLKYLQFKQYLSKLHKPQDLTQQFCQSLRVTMKDKFQDGMKKSANLLYNIKKQSMQSKMRQGSTQTDEEQTTKIEKKTVIQVPKAGQKLHNLLVKQRKLTQKLLGQLHNAKKQVQLLTIDKVNMQNIINDLDAKHFDLVGKYDILSKLYNEKRQELLILRKNYEDQLGVISRLKCFQMRFLKEFSPIQIGVQTDGPQTSDKDIQVRFQDNEIISILKRTNEKMGERIRQKQIRLKQIERKQVSDKKQKLGRLRISQVISPDAIFSIFKQELVSNNNLSSKRGSISSSGRRSQSNATIKDIQQLSKTLIEPVKRNSGRHSRVSQFADKRLSIQEASYIIEKSDERQNYIDDCCQTAQVCKCLQQQKSVQDQQTQVFLYIQQKMAKRQSFYPQSYKIIDYQQALTLNQSHRTKIFGQTKKRITILRDSQPQRPAQISSSYFKQSHQSQLLQPSKTRRQQYALGYFEKLNIETDDSRSSLQKRNALARNFIYNMKRKEKENQRSIDRNITCVGDFLREKLNTQEDCHSSNLINIERLDCPKKAKIDHKWSNPSNKSSKIPYLKQNSILRKIKE